ncbi:hypothetical protein AB205_0056440, partial [Aquarana catesbeiana]
FLDHIKAGLEDVCGHWGHNYCKDKTYEKNKVKALSPTDVNEMRDVLSRNLYQIRQRTLSYNRHNLASGTSEKQAKEILIRRRHSMRESLRKHNSLITRNRAVLLPLDCMAGHHISCQACGAQAAGVLAMLRFRDRLQTATLRSAAHVLKKAHTNELLEVSGESAAPCTCGALWWTSCLFGVVPPPPPHFPPLFSQAPNYMGDSDSDGGTSSQELNFYPRAKDILRDNRQKRAPFKSRLEWTDERLNSQTKESSSVGGLPLQRGLREPLLPKPRFGTLREDKGPKEESSTPVPPPRSRHSLEDEFKKKRIGEKRPDPRSPK